MRHALAADPERPRALERVRRDVEATIRRYAGGKERPLQGYGALLAAYGVVVGGLTLALHDRVPDRLAASDVALLSAATFKLSRHLARSPVMSTVRAPFTEFDSKAGPGEINEHPRTDSPFRHAVGELVTCPFCIGQWVATAFAGALVLAPKATRLVAATLTIAAAADGLHLLHSAGTRAADG